MEELDAHRVRPTNMPHHGTVPVLNDVDTRGIVLVKLSDQLGLTQQA